MTKEAQEKELGILKELIIVSEFDKICKSTLNNLLSKVEITEKTSREETLLSLVRYTCYPTRETKKDFYYKEMTTLIYRINTCYKYLNI